METASASAAAPGGLAADAEADAGGGSSPWSASPAAPSVRAFLAAGAMSASAAALGIGGPLRLSFVHGGGEIVPEEAWPSTL